MLRIARLTDRTGRYYTLDAGDGLGALLDGGPRSLGVGHWTGTGAGALGLSGAVSPSELADALCGRNPANGRPLSTHRSSISAYDLTFAAPKSVSVVLALAERAQAATVVASHTEAVGAAIGYVEDRAASARRAADHDRRVVAVDGLVSASFAHGVSRALDPHLHTHVVVANVGHGEDGRWSALDGRGLYAHARAAGALYDAHLRHALAQRLGIDWEQRANGAYEVAGVGPAVLGAFSSRRAEIALSAHEHRGVAAPGGPRPSGPPSARARAVAWAATREPKVAMPEASPLRHRWAGIAADAGLTPSGLAHAARVAPGPAEVVEHRFAAALERGPHGGVTRRDVVMAWTAAIPAGTPAAEAQRCVDQLADFDRCVGVAEPAHRPSAVCVAPWHLRALGPRPATARRLTTWQGAARSLDRYRERWPLDDPRAPRGVAPGPGALARMPATRLAEHLSLTRQLDDARRRLGRERVHEPAAAERSLGRA